MVLTMMVRYCCKNTLLFLLVILLTGCSSGWRAPLETRGTGASVTKNSSHAHTTAARQPFKASARSYRVRKGDTLYAIAWRSNTDFRDLASWNNIRKPYIIYAGQRIRLREPKTVKKLPQQSPSSRKKTTVKKTPSTKKRKKSTVVKTHLGKLHWQWPSGGRVIAKYKRGDTLRKGIKLAGKPGDKVKAAEAGRVVYSGSGLIGYGRLIIIKHNEKYLSAYAHNRKLLVKEGQQVTKGKQIAELGKANDGQPLLHFEIRRDGKPINPLALLPRR